jgi:lipoprotein-anchoring transpeptidase ErfK/SrfK
MGDDNSRLSRALWSGVAILAAALGAGAYVYWSATAPKPGAAPPASEASRVTPQPVQPPQPPQPPREAAAAATTRDGDLPPGVDGGSSDTELSYVFRRQPTFYRTLQPPGTIIIDKLQHFLYLIRPNNVALRYGIGVGEPCADLAGLRHIASMAEWPQWQAPPDLIKRRVADAGALPGGPGNPLGARVLQLDDGKSRIHGTNAPGTIGTSVAFGCIRLVNDDVVDLYGRVQAGTPVIVN